MIKKRDFSRYSRGSIVLHWLIALIVMLMLSLSFFLDDLPDQYQSIAFMTHKSLGLTVLFLMLFRFFWLKHTKRPYLPLSMPLWQRRLAYGVQHSLYFFLILMPLCGWIMSMAAGRVPSYFGLFPLPLPGVLPNKAIASFFDQAHTCIAWIIIGLLVLHVLGAMKHYFWDKDNIVQRILP